MLIITLVLSLTLVGLTVLALRKHQQQRHIELAEREQSLPPIDVTNDLSANQIIHAISPTAEPSPEYREESANARLSTTISADNSTEDWKEKCRAHRSAQQYQMALLCAETGWPQSQSYEQTALTIRAAIKKTISDDSSNLEKWLAALHRAAAESSLLYDKIPGEPEVRWQSIAKTHARQDISQIELPWDKIGANELKLLTKTDRKLMIQTWGEPSQHISAKVYYRLACAS